MKTSTFSRLVLVIILILVFGIVSNAFALGQLFTYLPIVMHDATPTPTSTPLPPSNPQLLDGYYKANLPNNGQIWFTVINSGTEAKDGGFLFQVAPFCPWGAYSFGGFTVPISDGKFSFFAFDYQNREFLASLSCQSLSANQATCNARQPMPGASGCGGITGIATRQ